MAGCSRSGFTVPGSAFSGDPSSADPSSVPVHRASMRSSAVFSSALVFPASFAFLRSRVAFSRASSRRSSNDLMLTRAATYSSIASCFVFWLSRTALRMLRFMSRMVFWLFATTIFLSLVFPSRRVCLPVARSTGHGVYIPHGGRRGV